MSTSDNIRNVNLTIFRQYIHHIPAKIFIHPTFQQTDLILSFASELGNDKGTGNFKPTWKVDRSSIEWVKNQKKINPHLRLVISIGGVGSEFSFAPTIDKEKWIANAVKSIKEIIHLYDIEIIHRAQSIIDGIDIHFDVIETTEEVFSYCIGKVIRELKHDGQLSINVVSIAPTKLVDSYYHKLYLANKNVIDLVDYQFYNQKFTSVKEVVDLYEKLVAEYAPAKVLPGISIPEHDLILYLGIQSLIKQKLIPGFFVWIIRDFIDGPNSFSLEKILENFD